MAGTLGPQLQRFLIDKELFQLSYFLFTPRTLPAATNFLPTTYMLTAEDPGTLGTTVTSPGTCSTPPHPQQSPSFQAPLLRNFAHILCHVEHVRRRRQETVREGSRAPHTPFFINIAFTARRTYKFTPVLHWRRYGRSLLLQHGHCFMSALFDALYEYLTDLKVTHPVRARTVGTALLELGACWDWDLASVESSDAAF